MSGGMAVTVPALKLHHFLQARRRIAPHIRRTPLVRSAFLSQLCRAEVWLKVEGMQPTGSFKVRGALHKLMQMPAEERSQGVVTASAGNHGLGLAYAAEALHLPSVTVFVPEDTPATKTGKLARYPITLRRVGRTYAEAHHAAEAFAAQTGAHYISAYNDVDVILGQGTCGLEIMLDLPETGFLFVPTGGGGLLSGVALTAKAINPGTRIIGIQPEASPAARLSFEQGLPLDPYDHEPTLAEGLAGGFGSLPFYLARTLVDHITLHSEAEIRRAIFTLLQHEQLVVEASGAIAIAPLLRQAVDVSGQTVVCILTGANIDPSLLASIVESEG